MVPPRRGLPWWVFAVALVLAAGVGFGIGALIWAGDPETMAEPYQPDGFVRLSPADYDRCIRGVTVHFDGADTDDRMRAAATRLGEDPRFESVKPRTRAESWEEFKRIFANQPDLLKTARPESLPASVLLVVRENTTSKQVEPQLRAEFPDSKVVTQDMCPR
ncbi:hypothetical protein EV193_103635 [Herbihabitans rhizosphaerae]|uniref:FtsX extracellular domain-containing protein n=1 Tax=Herbihabitans rhizosphaerae TaxID=1872711 RepID=A0A4V2ETJ7_9PSEU|nr:hypothetical protein EV193_103635 [Herbihabitans rhizosphaerae]